METLVGRQPGAGEVPQLRVVEAGEGAERRTVRQVLTGLAVKSFGVVHHPVPDGASEHFGKASKRNPLPAPADPRG